MSWTWALSTCRGTSHVRDRSECQDVSLCSLLRGDRLVSLVCDGAGSASHGKQGALLTARTILRHVRAHFDYIADAPGDDEIWEWLDAARDTIGIAAAARDLDPRQFACTLVLCIATPSETLIAHVGDGACVVAIDGVWQVASWPESGEYASTTYFVTDSPAARLRMTRISAIDALAMFTDGIERLVLDFGRKQAHTPWFERFIKPVVEGGVLGRNARLSAALHAYLDSSAVTEHSDDDKSLILAARI